MFVLGLLLALIAVGAFVVVLVGGAHEQALLFSGSVQTSTLVFFLAGAAALLVFIIGLELIRSGVGKANQRRKDRRRLRKLESREEARGQGATTPASGKHADTPAETPTTPETSEERRE